MPNAALSTRKPAKSSSAVGQASLAPGGPPEFGSAAAPNTGGVGDGVGGVGVGDGDGDGDGDAPWVAAGLSVELGAIDGVVPLQATTAAARAAMAGQVVERRGANEAVIGTPACDWAAG
jgi:hypothetical protein